MFSLKDKYIMLLDFVQIFVDLKKKIELKNFFHELLCNS